MSVLRSILFPVARLNREVGGKARGGGEKGDGVGGVHTGSGWGDGSKLGRLGWLGQDESKVSLRFKVCDGEKVVEVRGWAVRQALALSTLVHAS